MSQLKVGLIGLGNMGQNHLRVLSVLKEVELVFVYDRSEEKMQTAHIKYGVAPSSNLDVDLTRVDAVIIATPTSTHYDYILKVSDYVKNVFVEKPLTDTLEKTIEIQKIVHKKNINLQVGFIERFNPAVTELKKILTNSSKVINIEFTRTNKLSNRITDVDVVLDLMIHDIDLALLLMGDVVDVQAYGVVENEMIVFASAVFKHLSGSFSRITASRITEKRIRQIDVTCEDMFVDCNLLKKEIVINRQTSLNTYNFLSISSYQELVSIPSQEALLMELLDFVQIRNLKVKSDRPNIHSAISSIELAEKIKRQIMGC